MKKRNLFVLIIMFTVISIPQLIAQTTTTLESHQYIFFVAHRVISGTSDQGFMYIDFPTFSYNSTNRTLDSFVSISLTEQTQVILGEGLSLSGDVGGGASTQLSCYDELNKPDKFTADVNGIVQFNHEGTWLTISPGETWTETVQTDAYPPFTGDLTVTYTYRNLGIWDKSNITAPELTPTPTDDPGMTPDPTPTPMDISIGDVNQDGIVDIIDALLTAQYYVGLSPAGFYQTMADVDCNNSVDIVDALLIARYFVGLIVGFCL